MGCSTNLTKSEPQQIRTMNLVLTVNIKKHDRDFVNTGSSPATKIKELRIPYTSIIRICSVLELCTKQSCIMKAPLNSIKVSYRG